MRVGDNKYLVQQSLNCNYDLTVMVNIPPEGPVLKFKAFRSLRNPRLAVFLNSGPQNYLR